MEDLKVYIGSSKLKSSRCTGYEMYSTAWSLVIRDVRRRQNEIYKSMIDDLLYFIEYPHFQIYNGEGSQTISQIPTALLLAGANTPDHQTIYDRVISSTTKHGGCVAIVTAGSETMSLRSMISSVVKQFTSGVNRTYGDFCFDLISESDVESDDPNCPQKQSSETPGDPFMEQFTPAVRSTYWALSEWYHHKTKLEEQTSNADCHSIAALRSRRSISQPNATDQTKANRPLRATMRPRANQLSVRGVTRRFTARPDVTSVPRVGGSTRCQFLDNPSNAARSKPLVIVLSQVESIPNHVLQDFIELTTMFVSGQATSAARALPICLVLALSTPPEMGFEARLNASSLAKLKVKRFAVPPPASFLECVLNSLVDSPGFHLTYSVCSYLVDSLFLCLDYSVQNFLRRLQFCMLEHYLSCPHPALLLPPNDAQVYLQSLSSTDLANLITVCFPSLAKLASGAGESPTSCSALSTGCKSSQSSLIVRLVAQLKAHWKLQYFISPVLRWLMNVTSAISISPLGKSVSELYRRWLKNGMTESEEFTVCKTLLSALTKDDIVKSLQKAAAALQSDLLHRQSQFASATTFPWPVDIISSCNESLAELVRSTQAWADSLNCGSSTCPTVPSSLIVPESPSRSTCPTALAFRPSQSDKRKISIRSLRQHVQEIAATSPARYGISRDPSQSEWEQKRSELLMWISSTLNELIPKLTSIPLHEVFYGPSARLESDAPWNQHRQQILAIRRRLNPAYQKQMHQALVDPTACFKVLELRADSTERVNQMLPDLCILYGLHLESTKMINLYDWLMAFATVLGENVDKENPPNKLIQARFFHGLAQLHHMGYIKSNRRRVDHVMRLTWGSSFV